MKPMPSTDIETPLQGGRYTVGVVRIADTVRRPTSPASPFVARLLNHLEQRDCPFVPKHLGLDDLGRDTFSYIPGWVPAKFQSFDNAQVCRAAELLRAFHDATRGSTLAAGREVVCHHDPGPNNTVFQDGVPVAFIDFDFAAPGDSIEDLAYLAWTWCISSKPSRGPAERQAKQLRGVCDSYGLDASGRRRLIDAIIQRQQRNIGFWSDHLEKDVGQPTSPEKIQERIDWSKDELNYTERNATLFYRAIKSSS